MEKTYGKSIKVTIMDKLYSATKLRDTDNDTSTSSTKLNADQKVVVRDQLMSVLRIKQETSLSLVTAIGMGVYSTNIVVNPVQFASLMMFAKTSPYIEVSAYDLFVQSTVTDLTGTGV